MKTKLEKNEALALLKKYNKEPFHILHGLTVDEVMRWYAGELGYGEDSDFWEIAGLLHDIDFEMYPEEHCTKAPELLREGGAAYAPYQGHPGDRKGFPGGDASGAQRQDRAP